MDLGVSYGSGGVERWILPVGVAVSPFPPLSPSHTHMHTDGNINHNCSCMAEFWVVCAFFIISNFFFFYNGCVVVNIEGFRVWRPHSHWELCVTLITLFNHAALPFLSP